MEFAMRNCFLAQAGYGSCLTCEEFISNVWVRRNRRAPEFRQKADPPVDTMLFLLPSNSLANVTEKVKSS